MRLAWTSSSPVQFPKSNWVAPSWTACAVQRHDEHQWSAQSSRLAGYRKVTAYAACIGGRYSMLSRRNGRQPTLNPGPAPLQSLMNRFLARGLAASVCLCIAATASDHYLWISADSDPEGRRGTNIYFEAAPKPGDSSYLDHFLGKSDVWIPTIEQPSPAHVRATEIKEGDNRWMQVALPSAPD